MPGTNLTREEAATRAALVTVDSHDVELDVTTGPEHFSTRSTIRFTLQRAGRRDLHRLHRRRPSRRSPSTASDARPGRALRRQPHRACPACAAENERRRRRDRPLHQHRRGPAPLRRPGRRRGLPLHPVRGARQPTDVRRLRAARPQGRASPSPSPRRPTGRSCPTPRPRARRRRVDGPARDVALRPDPARSPPTSRPSSPGPYDVVRDDVHDPRAATCRSASSAAGR